MIRRVGTGRRVAVNVCRPQAPSVENAGVRNVLKGNHTNHLVGQAPSPNVPGPCAPSIGKACSSFEPD